MSFGQAIRSVYVNYAKFDGRASRSEYWWFQLFIVLAAVGFYFIATVLVIATRSNEPAAIVGFGFLIGALLTIVPGLAVTVRRLHDTDKSGWWMLITLFPYIGTIVLLIFLALRSSRGYNSFGPPEGVSGADQRAYYWGPSRSDALRKFAEDAQRASAAGYEPVWQEWRPHGGGEVLEVAYGSRPVESQWIAPQWIAPSSPWNAATSAPPGPMANPPQSPPPPGP
jgi:uncharacterized membrane protein YhaH (DUF805 family)